MGAICVMKLYGYMRWSPMGAMSVMKFTILVHAMVSNESHVCGEDIPIYNMVPNGSRICHKIKYTCICDGSQWKPCLWWNKVCHEIIHTYVWHSSYWETWLPLGTIACIVMFRSPQGQLPLGTITCIAILYVTIDIVSQEEWLPLGPWHAQGYFVHYSNGSHWRSSHL